MSGVQLIRSGPSGEQITTYDVVEPLRRRHFSHPDYLRPLQAAVVYFLHHALSTIDRKERTQCCGK